jgi:hypothetical protein
MLKPASSFVLGSSKSSTYPSGYVSGFDSPAASLENWFEHLKGSWKKQRPWRRKSKEETSMSAQAIGSF